MMRFHNRARRGNTVVIALITLAAAMSLAVISTNSAVSTSSRVRIGFDQQRALAAVDAVLSRRELMVIQLGNRGDPAEFARWRQNFGTENYGVDYIGDCEVRWRIEPVRTRDTNHSGEDIEYITNPSPAGASLVSDKELSNDYVYLFRVAAEARINSDLRGTDNELFPRARAQGVRFASVNKQPLFRYVIFYAQEGAKGDLELSHADAAVIRGNVHSNGAIYIGASTVVNGWGAVTPGNQQTALGPDADGRNVFVTGVGGIFRLAKPLMFGAINKSLDPAWSSMPMTGSAPSGWAAGTAYNTDARLFPTEVVMPSGNTVWTMTVNGTVINPYRITNDSGFITKALSGNDDKRTINGTAILGQGSNANDSRDDEREATAKWNPLSLQGAGPPNGFSGFARTQITSGRVVRLPTELRGRPLEVQSIQEIDGDGDPTTDEHQLARPGFLVTASGSTTATTTVPATGARVEQPGSYTAYALGSKQLALTRLNDGTGWTVSSLNGVATGLTQPASVGLFIRERPIPAIAIWPGSQTVPIVDSTHPDYMPFAYGKHYRPTAKPYLAMDVSADTSYESMWSDVSRRGMANLGVDTSGNGRNEFDQGAWRDINMDSSLRQDGYDGAGGFRVRAAMTPGPHYPDGHSPGDFVANRKAYYYQENWRFLHLRQPKPSTTTGVHAMGWADPYTFGAGPSNQLSRMNAQQTGLLGPAAVRLPVSQVNFNGGEDLNANAALDAGEDLNQNGSLTTNANDSNQKSARWEGFVVPPSSGTYYFSVKADDQARVWIDERLVIMQGNYSSNQHWSSLAMDLIKDRPYRIVVEFLENAGGDNCNLYWRYGSNTWALVPQANLRRQEPSYGFSWKDFRAIQARIQVAAGGPTQQKIGLMLRPSEGASPLQSGRDPYVAVLFSPARGFFTQRRLRPAQFSGGQRAVQVNFVGSTTTASVSAANTAGEVEVAMGAADPIRQAVLTPTAAWVNPSVQQTSVSVNQPSSTQIVSTKTPGSWSASTLENVDLGDGRFLSGTSYLPKGSLILKETKQRQVRAKTYTQWTKWRERDLELRMTGHVAAGLFGTAPNEGNGGNSRTIAIHSADVGAGTFASWAGNLWWATAGDTIIRRYRTETSGTNESSNPWEDYGTPTTAESVDYASDTDRTVLDPLPKIINSAGQTLSSPDSSVVIALLNANAAGGPYRYRTAAPTYPTASDPATTTDRPAETGTATVADPDPINDPWGGTVSRTFSVNRSSQIWYGYQDVNPYIVTGATWFTAGAPALLPWRNEWAGTTVALSLDPVTTTYAFQPDLWRQSSAPTRVPWHGVTSLPQTGLVDHSGRWAGDQPTSWTYDASQNYVLRIARDMTASQPTVRFYYYVGALASPPADDPGWTELPGSADVQWWLDSYKTRSDAADPLTIQMLVGLCVQSGNKNTPTEALFDSVKIELNDTLANPVIDQDDWNADAFSPRDQSRYLASQYQVFWGIHDITEDFFTWNEGVPGSRTATEEWIYNPREFWSQSRWWDAAMTLEKDPPPSPVGSWTTFDYTSVRTLLAKQSLLTLNMRAVQDYIRLRTLGQAKGKPITAPSATPDTTATRLVDQFNGLFYAVRTNRYPWNPTSGDENPWSSIDRPLPETNGVSLDSTSFNFVNSTDGRNLLQPYALQHAPPFQPQEFIHGVRLTNAASIDWGMPASGIPAFGTSKSSVVTPNQLLLQGNLNTTTRTQSHKGVDLVKETPLAVMGDVVVLLSNAFDIRKYQTDGLRVVNQASSSVSGVGILAQRGGKEGTTTTYNASILTHNQPTTKASVKEGQGAPFIDTMLFLESWNQGGTAATMRFKGSLVVMNTRRHTRSFLLDVDKTSGRTPFGTTGWQKSPADWLGACPPVYSAPNRAFDFNYDLLTEEGTPPFTPFGVTAAGVGGWTRVLR